MRQKSVSIVFTGQLRDTAMFERSLNAMAKLGFVKEIVFSTWHGTAFENRDYLRGLAAKYRLTVVTSTEPASSITRQSGLMQSITLRRGLDALKNPEYVLKTRTDSEINPEAIRYLAEKDHTITDPEMRKLRIFEEKISVTSASILIPFYIDDQMIFGRHTDLKKLCATDLGDFKYARSPKVAHYIRFYPPFEAHFPMFRHFFKREILLSTSNFDFRNALLPMMLGRREFSLALLTYYRIVSAFFCMDWGGHSVALRNEPIPYIDGSETDIFKASTTHTASNAFFSNACQGLFENGELAGYLREPAEALRANADLRDVGIGLDFPAMWDEVAAHAARMLDLEGHYNKAVTLMREPEGIGEAFKIINLVQPAFPFEPRFNYLLALCFSAIGDRAKAIDHLNACLELGESWDSPAGELLAELTAGK